MFIYWIMSKVFRNLWKSVLFCFTVQNRWRFCKI